MLKSARSLRYSVETLLIRCRLHCLVGGIQEQPKQGSLSRATLRAWGGTWGAIYLFLASTTVGLAADNWNGANIQWLGYDEGVEQAALSGKPIMLVLHTEYCGACQDYAEVFFDADVVRLSGSMVMVLVDDYTDEEIGKRYREDGGYTPRTYFLNAEAELLNIKIGKPESRFQYYFGNRPASALVDYMQQAIDNG